MAEQAKLNSKWRKAAIATGAGAVFGFVAASAFMRMADLPSVDLGSSAEVAGLVGIIYLLTALMVAVGVVHPGFGARFLNVEDALELQEQRRLLAFSASSITCMGAALLLAALSGPAGPITPYVGLIALPLILLGIVLGLAQWRYADELMKMVSRESATAAFYLLFAFGGGWALLAQLGYAAAPAPLDWLSMIYAAGLVGSFIASGRRGMLNPR
ncbi:hypothetical protein OZN62_05790 [Aurantiacibacter sp. MUD11]|uniref:hypothetical protein n=1 Tax=Aurantiacibacter sp. MUD11 TaxID=3003265 RepID=UPI0022AAA294|nr:hypothetical protein [Aurantiacibacter sp. MUD11]WAT19076.1 hypothetical protein OZN62_05790 [Aurantiacibacter sp. MUD11]